MQFETQTDLLQTFKASMQMDHEKFRDGIGYETELIPKMNAAQRHELEALLLRRLQCPSVDWRDVEALDALDTPVARAALAEARRHPNRDVSTAVASLVMRDQGPAAAEADIVRAIGNSEPMNGLDKALRMAAECNTPRVRAAVLERSRKAGDRVVRVNMAGLLHFLCGKAEEPFDWNHRPFYLRFGEESELNAAWEELRQTLNDFEKAGGGR